MSNSIHKRVNTKGTEETSPDLPRSPPTPATSPVVSAGLRRTKPRSLRARWRVFLGLSATVVFAILGLLYYETTHLLRRGAALTETDTQPEGLNEQRLAQVFGAKGGELLLARARSVKFFNRSRKAFKYSSLRPTTTRYLDELEAFGRGGYSNCTLNETAWGREHVCCSMKHKKWPQKRFRWCLPGLVVMGSQKGGSTALHSYLMLHPNLETSASKELHVYDVLKNFQKLPRMLPHHFAASTNRSFLFHRLNFESTPSYMASADACKRMATLLPSSTVFVAILRDPVKRAWSELKMKERRVAAQAKYLRTEFIPKIRVIYACLRKRYQGRDVPDLTDSFEKVSFSSMPRHNERALDRRIARKIQAAQSKRLSNSSSSAAWPLSPAKNHSRYRKGDFPNCLRQAGATDLAKDPRTRLFETALRRRVDSKPDQFLPHCFRRINGTIEWNTQCYTKLRIFRENVPKLPEVLIGESADLRSRCIANLHMREALHEWQEANYARKSRVERLTDKQNDCWLKHFTERCESCKNLSTCFHCFQKVRSLLNLTACEEGNLNYRGPRSCKGPWCSCFPLTPMISDISKHFLWRGMYDIHLKNCMRYIPSERIVILENQDLRARPAETMNRIQLEAGIPLMDYSKTTYKHAHSMFTKRYPSFEATTGWSNNGTANSEPPQDVQKVLQEFYKDQNERLFRLLGRRFEHWL